MITALKILRMANDMILDDITELGLSKWTYLVIEKGDTKASRKYMVALSKHFGIDISKIFNKDGHPIAFDIKEIVEIIENIDK